MTVDEKALREAVDRAARTARSHSHHALWAGLPTDSLERFGIALAQRIESAIRSNALEAAKLPAPEPAAVQRGRVDTGWLVELKGRAPSWAILNPNDYDEHWTEDAAKAIRFARREDAQAYIDHVGWTEAFPSEHIWDDGSRYQAAMAGLSKDLPLDWIDDSNPEPAPSPAAVQGSGVEAVIKAAREVEQWWLEQGMSHFNGAPYAIYAIRKSLADLNRITSPAPTSGSEAGGEAVWFGFDENTGEFTGEYSTVKPAETRGMVPFVRALANPAPAAGDVQEECASIVDSAAKVARSQAEECRAQNPERAERYEASAIALDEVASLIRAALSAPASAPGSGVAEGFALVPVDALRWLNGEHEDGFRKPEAARGNFWWRTEFKRRCAASPSPAQGETR